MAHSADTTAFAVVYSAIWDRITETTAELFATAEEVPKKQDGPPAAAQAILTAALGIYDALPTILTHRLVQSANQSRAADAWRADAAAGLGHHGRRQLLSHDAPPLPPPAALPRRPGVPEDEAHPFWDALGRVERMVKDGFYGTAAGTRTVAPTQPRGRLISGAGPAREVGGGEMARAVGQGAAVLISELSDLARDPDARDGPSETPDVLSPGGEAVLWVLGCSAELLSAAASLGVQVDLVGIIGDATASTVEKATTTVLARDPDSRDGPSEIPDALSPGSEAVLRALARSAELLSAATSSAAQAIGTAALCIYDALPSGYTHRLVQSANQGAAADAWRADAAAGLGHHGRRQLLGHDAPPPSRPEGPPEAQPWRPAVPEDDAHPLWNAFDHMERMALIVKDSIYGTAAGTRTAAPTQPRGHPKGGSIPVREVGGGEMVRAVGQGAAMLMSELSGHGGGAEAATCTELERIRECAQAERHLCRDQLSAAHAAAASAERDADAARASLGAEQARRAAVEAELAAQTELLREAARFLEGEHDQLAVEGLQLCRGLREAQQQAADCSEKLAARERELSAARAQLGEALRSAEDMQRRADVAEAARRSDAAEADARIEEVEAACRQRLALLQRELDVARLEAAAAEKGRGARKGARDAAQQVGDWELREAPTASPSAAAIPQSALAQPCAYAYEGTLGQGVSGCVIKIRRKKDQKHFACKILPLWSGDTSTIPPLEEAKLMFEGCARGSPGLHEVLPLRQIEYLPMRLLWGALLPHVLPGEPITVLGPAPQTGKIARVEGTAVTVVVANGRGDNEITVSHADLEHGLLATDGMMGIVMPLLTGGSMEDLIKGNGKPALTVAEVARMLVDVGSALQHLWAKGRAHRDCHPGNVMIDGSVRGKRTFYLIDYGRAHRFGEQDKHEHIDRDVWGLIVCGTLALGLRTGSGGAIEHSYIPFELLDQPTMEVAGVISGFLAHAYPSCPAAITIASLLGGLQKRANTGHWCDPGPALHQLSKLVDAAQ